MSDVPTFLLSGAYDPVTLSYWTDRVAASLSRSRSLRESILSHEANGVTHPECLVRP
jgi:hypothetical protein